MKYLRHIIPWVIAVGIFFYLFRQYPPRDLVAASQFLNIPLFCSYAVIYFLYMWYVDCWALARIMTRFHIPLRAKELFQVRFASYLIMVVNYGAGQAGLAYFIKRHKHASLPAVLGTILFVLVIDLYWTINLAFIGSYFARPVVRDVPLFPIISMIWLIATSAILINIAFWKFKAKNRFVKWMQEHPASLTFRKARLIDYGWTLLLRLPMHIAINTAIFFVAWTFGVSIPFWKVVSSLPIVILAGTIPITPGGLGTVQVATIELFKNSVSGAVLSSGQVQPAELLFAMSLLMIFSNYFLKAVTGSLFLNKVLSPAHLPKTREP